MALKTVSKLNISKNGPLSVDMQKAVTVDQAVIHDDATVDYIDGEEVLDVKATTDQKQAIIDANRAELDAIEKEPVKEAPADVANDILQATETVAEKAKRKYGISDPGKG